MCLFARVFCRVYRDRRFVGVPKIEPRRAGFPHNQDPNKLPLISKTPIFNYRAIRRGDEKSLGSQKPPKAAASKSRSSAFNG